MDQRTASFRIFRLALHRKKSSCFVWIPIVPAFKGLKDIERQVTGKGFPFWRHWRERKFWLGASFHDKQSTEVENHLILVVVASSSFLCHKLILESLLLPLGHTMGYHKGSDLPPRGFVDFRECFFLWPFFVSINQRGLFGGPTNNNKSMAIHRNPWKLTSFTSVFIRLRSKRLCGFWCS